MHEGILICRKYALLLKNYIKITKWKNFKTKNTEKSKNSYKNDKNLKNFIKIKKSQKIPIKITKCKNTL